MSGTEVAAPSGDNAAPSYDKIVNSATSNLDRKKELQKFSKLSPEEISALGPEKIKKIMAMGADLDESGKPKQKDSSLKIHIELDLDVEIHLNARVQGDITIGLLSG